MIHHSIDHGYLRAVILYLLNPYPESRRRNFFGETDQLLYTTSMTCDQQYPLSNSAPPNSRRAAASNGGRDLMI